MEDRFILSGRGLDKIREAVRKTGLAPMPFRQKRSPRMAGEGGTKVRTAQIQSVSPSYYTCKLWTYASGNWALESATITVYPVMIIGSNNLTGNIWPKMAAEDDITVYQEQDDTWTTPIIVDDTVTCET